MVLRDTYLSVVSNSFNWRHNSGSSRTESLDHAALFDSADDLLDGVFAFNDIKLTPCASKRQDGVTSNSRKDSSIKRSRDQFTSSFGFFPEEELIHGTNLSDFISKEPEDLGVSLFSGFTLGMKCHGVVSSALDVSSTTGPGADILGVSVQLNGSKSTLVVGSNRTHDTVEFCLR